MLGTTNITTTLIGNEIGSSSRTLSILNAGARTGGRNGYAFNVVAAGGTAVDGYLIDGATPLFNIFSNESPGEWASSDSGDGPLRFRIKRDSGGHNYRFAFGDWRSYNHLAIGPDDYKETVEVAVGSPNLRIISIHFRTGSYDWRKVSGANAVLFVVLKDGMLLAVSSILDLTAVNMTIVGNVTLPISTTSPHTEVFTLRLLVGRRAAINDFNPFGYVPAEGTITVVVYKPLEPVVFFTRLDGIPVAQVRMEAAVTEFPSYYSCAGRYTGSDYWERYLYKIEYKIVNSEGAIGSTVTVTSGFNGTTETPYYFDYGRDTGTGTFVQTASKTRLVTTAAYPQLQITMYYKK